MRVRIWPAVGISFAVLLLLVPVFAWLVSREAGRIDVHTREAHRTYQQADDAITEIRGNIYKAALLVRDASQNQDQLSAASQLNAIRLTTEHDFATLSSLLDSSQHAHLVALRRGLDDYWASLFRVLETTRQPSGRPTMTPDESERSRQVLQIAEQIDALNEANLSVEEQQIQSQQRTLRQFATGATAVLLLLGVGIAAVSTVYLARLERVSENEKTRAEAAEYELRRLSNQLIRVQEDERRIISRELHDEVGQILTGLRMELAGLSRADATGTLRPRLESVKRLAEDALRSVRNLALLLRPSMLDDLGLEPALRWQTKEFSRRSGIPVSLHVEGSLNALPETVRVCVYRAVQEALTNCLKHAEATRVSVTIEHREDLVSASVQDNGKGFDVNQLSTPGLGLLGMEERVRALQGQLTVGSQPGKGTLVSLALPVTAERAAAGA